jgi:hypothetical protein
MPGLTICVQPFFKAFGTQPIYFTAQEQQSMADLVWYNIFLFRFVITARFLAKKKVCTIVALYCTLFCYMDFLKLYCTLFYIDWYNIFIFRFIITARFLAKKKVCTIVALYCTLFCYMDFLKLYCTLFYIDWYNIRRSYLDNPVSIVRLFVTQGRCMGGQCMGERNYVQPGSNMNNYDQYVSNCAAAECMRWYMSEVSN